MEIKLIFLALSGLLIIISLFLVSTLYIKVWVIRELLKILELTDKLSKTTGELADTNLKLFKGLNERITKLENGK